MAGSSAGDAGLKRIEGETEVHPPPPRFEPSKLLDAISALLTESPGHAKIALTTIDGTHFECFADGITLKALSDKFLAFAGHVLLQTRGENIDLQVRPLAELHDDAPDEPEAPPPTPSEIGRALTKSEPVMPQASEPSEATGWQPPAPLADERNAPAREPDEGTIDFIESFHTKPDVFFESEFVRATVKKLIANVDKSHPKVIEIAKRVGFEL